MYEDAKSDTETQSDDAVEQPTMTLLLDEHRILMTSLSYSRIVNRVLLFSLVVLQVTLVLQLGWKHILIVVAGAFVAGSWYLTESSASQRVHRISDFIAQAATDKTVIRTFILWRHELWQHSTLERLERIEPILWLLLVLVTSFVH